MKADATLKPNVILLEVVEWKQEVTEARVAATVTVEECAIRDLTIAPIRLEVFLVIHKLGEGPNINCSAYNNARTQKI